MGLLTAISHCPSPSSPPLAPSLSSQALTFKSSCLRLPQSSLSGFPSFIGGCLALTVRGGTALRSTLPASPTLVSSFSDLFDFICAGPLMKQLGFTAETVAESIDNWITTGVQLCRLFRLNDLSLSPSERARIYHFYVPVFLWCQEQLKRHRTTFGDDVDVPPLVIGVSAPQGSGKTTLVFALDYLFRQSGRRSATLSIDDFYLTAEDQAKLRNQNPSNALLEFRGNAGSHDLQFSIDTLTSLKKLTKNGMKMKLPRYDKSAYGGRGDRPLSLPFRRRRIQPRRKDMVSSLSPLLTLLLFLILLQHSSSDPVVYPSKSKMLSWNPRAFVYEGLLTEEECDHLISLARLELKRSAVADNLSGKSTLSEVRTSSGMFIGKGKDPIISGIEDKIAAWTFLPKENGEDIQVLRYEHGQKYDPHFDYFSDKVNIVRGGHRIATVLMYLSDVAKGGETVFPSAQELSQRGTHVKDDDLSECAQRGVAVKPKRGDALLFFSLHPDATTDPHSLHAGCPVLEGEKWSATKWIHVASFDKIITSQGNCTDENNNCARWAALGECTKNPEYMVGTSELPGFCRRSCDVC